MLHSQSALRQTLLLLALLVITQPTDASLYRERGANHPRAELESTTPTITQNERRTAMLSPRAFTCEVAQVNCQNGWCCGPGQKCVIRKGKHKCLLAGNNFFTPTPATRAKGGTSKGNGKSKGTAPGSAGTSAPAGTQTGSSGTSGTDRVVPEDGVGNRAIAGIIVGVVVVVVIVGLAFLILRWRRKRRAVPVLGQNGQGKPEYQMYGADKKDNMLYTGYEAPHELGAYGPGHVPELESDRPHAKVEGSQAMQPGDGGTPERVELPG